MKSLWQSRKLRAFTLVEMLVVIAIIGILAALLLPVLSRGKQRAQRIQCIGDLKEIGTAFQIFAHDHRGKFPMQVPREDGGSLEYVTASYTFGGDFYFSYRHFQSLVTELVVPKILVCPSDAAREAAATFGTLQNSNVSYFVGVNATFDSPQTMLAGDRNVTNDWSRSTSIAYGNQPLRWTRELHFFKGNVLFSDAHVEEMNSPQIPVAGNPATTLLFLPSVPAAFVTSPRPPGITSGSGPSQAGNSGQTPAPVAMQHPYASDSNAPSPTPPRPLRSAQPGSTTVATDESAPTIFPPDAKETNGVAVTNSPVSPAAPAATDDEPMPPLLWLLGAAQTLVAKASWWLLLLLALLIGTAVYLYARRRMHERRRR
jgi:prepilin-type N-terminal cleavage/methylation domain-containing protein